MRLNAHQIKAIRAIVAEEAGDDSQVHVFGSRLDDTARGGDLDLMVRCPDAVARPAWLSARIGSRVGRVMHGRAVDVVIAAPNLMRQSIHETAEREGHRL